MMENNPLNNDKYDNNHHDDLDGDVRPLLLGVVGTSNENNQHANYLATACEATNDDITMPATAVRRRRERRVMQLPFHWSLLLFGLVCCLPVFFLSPPTNKELEILQYYNKDSIGVVFDHYLPGFATYTLRRAQNIADTTRQQELLLDEDENANEDGSQSHRRLLRRQLEQHLDDEEEENPTDDDNNNLNRPRRVNDEKKYLQEGCETTVLIVRHCEKGSVTEHCAYQGYERSVYLATLFGKRWPVPTMIFAESPNARHKYKMNFREIETVGPLSHKFNLTVDDSYSDRNITKMTKSILREIRKGNMCGRLIVVAWKHSSIAHMAHHMGCGPKQGCPVDYHGRTFDEVWQMKFVFRHWEHSTHKKHFVTPVAEKKLVQNAKWKVFGSVQNENFDPLAVSYAFGDYPSSSDKVGTTTTGTSVGGRWQKHMVAYPEREKPQDTDGWVPTQVGFPRHGPE